MFNTLIAVGEGNADYEELCGMSSTPVGLYSVELNTLYII